MKEINVGKYCPIHIVDEENGWSFSVDNEQGIEKEGEPTLEQFYNAAKSVMTETLSKAFYYAAWPKNVQIWIKETHLLRWVSVINY